VMSVDEGGIPLAHYRLMRVVNRLHPSQNVLAGRDYATSPRWLGILATYERVRLQYALLQVMKETQPERCWEGHAQAEYDCMNGLHRLRSAPPRRETGATRW